MKKSNTSNHKDITRRKFLEKTGKLAATTAVALTIPGMLQPSFAQDNKTIRIGFIGPRSGPLSSFGEGDSFLVNAFNKQMASGIKAGGNRYDIQLVLGDTQSDSVRASQVAKDMINGDNIDFMLTSSTPETVNPVADTCEAAGIPCLSTTAPWEGFYFGRGAKPGEPSPFKWTYHFCFGVHNFALLYADQWGKVKTNKRLAVLYPNDADGNAIRAMLVPELEAAGYTVIDPGPYENGTSDFSSQINLYKKEKCEVFNTFPFPPDFAVFWRQAAQKGFAQQVKICQLAKAGLFPAELEALGSLGFGLHAGAYWHKHFPFNSVSTGLSCLELGNGYEAAVKKQWNQQVGANASLLDAAVIAISNTENPKDKAALAKSISTLKAETAVGVVDFTSGPVPNCATTGLVGVQWVKAKKGPYMYDLDIVSNANHQSVPMTAQMTPYRIQG